MSDLGEQSRQMATGHRTRLARFRVGVGTGDETRPSLMVLFVGSCWGRPASRGVRAFGHGFVDRMVVKILSLDFDAELTLGRTFRLSGG